MQQVNTQEVTYLPEVSIIMAIFSLFCHQGFILRCEILFNKMSVFYEKSTKFHQFFLNLALIDFCSHNYFRLLW